LTVSDIPCARGGNIRGDGAQGRKKKVASMGVKDDLCMGFIVRRERTPGAQGNSFQLKKGGGKSSTENER